MRENRNEKTAAEGGRRITMESIDMTSAYRYKGFSIIAIYRRFPGFAPRLCWDIFNGEVLVKSNFSTVEMAKHYIDRVLGGNGSEKG